MIQQADVFLDTTILIYAAMGRKADADKFAAARQIILEEDYATSSDVLAEFYTHSTTQGAKPLSTPRAAEWVKIISKKPCQSIDTSLVNKAIMFSDAYDISYRNGSNVAAAERLGAKQIYTEDLNHGALYGKIQAINPFLTGEE